MCFTIPELAHRREPCVYVILNTLDTGLTTTLSNVCRWVMTGLFLSQPLLAEWVCVLW